MSGHLGYRLGQVLYEEYFWSIFDFQAPLLVIGDDPLLILNPAVEDSGSFSQVLTARGGTASLDNDPKLVVESGLTAIRNNEFVVLPLDPRRALVLSKPHRLILPGRHPGEAGFAAALNTYARKASREWVVFPPGQSERVREAIYAQHPWRRRFDAHRANSATAIV